MPSLVMMNSAPDLASSGENPISKRRTLIDVEFGMCLFNLEILNCVVTKLVQAKPRLGTNLSLVLAFIDAVTCKTYVNTHLKHDLRRYDFRYSSFDLRCYLIDANDRTFVFIG